MCLCASCALYCAELLFRFSGVSRLDELNDYIFGALGVSLSCQILFFDLNWLLELFVEFHAIPWKMC